MATDVKCVVVGNDGIGKTCLIMAYATNAFPAEYIPTVFNYTSEHKFNKETVTIGVWDTAGQEDYARLRPLSYAQADIFLLCYSINSRWSFDSIDGNRCWIVELKYHCPNVPIMLIGTKDDYRNEQGETLKKLIHGYSREWNDIVIPMDIYGIIEVYLETKYDLITDEEGQKLCDKIGGYKYMSCSAVKLRGIQEIFDEVCSCCIKPTKHKRGCNLL